MSAEMMPLLTKALGETVYMVLVSMIIASAVGIPLGVLLHVTAKGEILDAPGVNRTVGAVVNAVRSVPFIILMVAIIPLTRLIVGSAIGTTAAMVPLVIASVPFIGRQVETSLREVPHGLIEAALAMGATPMQIVTRVLLPESMPGIVSQLTTVVIALVGESAICLLYTSDAAETITPNWRRSSRSAPPPSPMPRSSRRSSPSSKRTV